MNLIGLIKSKTREKILRFFFSHKENKYYLRELERILSLPVGNIRRELISLEKTGLFKKEKTGNLVYYFLNQNSPLFGAIENTFFKKKGKDVKQSEEEDLFTIKKEDLNLLVSRINDLKNILENLSASGNSSQKSEFKRLFNLELITNRPSVKVKKISRDT